MTKAPKATAKSTNVGEYTVSELSGAIKRSLEDGFGYVRLRGEVSGYRGPHASGHCYFGLKDEKSKIDAVIWRGSFGKLKFRPEEGMEVIAQGRITTYPGSSKYQIVIDTLEPAGVGALMALLEERKKKFAAEGLFDEDKKQPLPFLPRVIGIVTSPTGAVIRDMLHGFDERFPAHVVVWPVRVQGETSAEEVAAAINGFNALPQDGALPRPDVLIVARGGGSLEDLWGFNEEVVVRAVAASALPVISAVGHETDWTLIDLVADARAPTPTKAAEWAVPKYAELLDTIAELSLRTNQAVHRTLESQRTHLRAAERGLPRPQDLTALKRQHFDTIEHRLSGALITNTRNHAMRWTSQATRLQPRLLSERFIARRQDLRSLAQRASQGLYRLTSTRRTKFERLAGAVQSGQLTVRIQHGNDQLTLLSQRSSRALRIQFDRKQNQFTSASKLLSTLSYRNVLSRGYAVVRQQSGDMVRRIGDVAPGSTLAIEFADGFVTARAEVASALPPEDNKNENTGKPSPTRRPAPRSAARRKNKTEQGSLF